MIELVSAHFIVSKVLPMERFNQRNTRVLNLYINYSESELEK
jgi:hypothetical protein